MKELKRKKKKRELKVTRYYEIISNIFVEEAERKIREEEERIKREEQEKIEAEERKKREEAEKKLKGNTLPQNKMLTNFRRRRKTKSRES
jgi:activator of 2-hydroxyglutaryl-CoA dehydratase